MLYTVLSKPLQKILDNSEQEYMHGTACVTLCVVAAFVCTTDCADHYRCVPIK